MKKLPSNIWDRLTYMSRCYHDMTMHFRLDYEGHIDNEIFRKALVFMVDHTDVLHSSFHYGFFAPYWRVEDYSCDDIFRLSHLHDDSFFTSGILPSDKVKIRVILYQDKPDSFSLEFLISHIAFDGGDAKYFFKKLSETYRDMMENREPPFIRNGPRNHDAIYSSFEKKNERKARHLFRYSVRAENAIAFPYERKSDDDHPFIIHESLTAEETSSLIRLSREAGVTVNDTLLYAFKNALRKYISASEFEISSAMDLRRYIRDIDSTGLSNNTAWMIIKIGKDASLKEVNAITGKMKENPFMGLEGIPLLNFGFTCIPYALSEKIVRKFYKNPNIAMSNVGIITNEDVLIPGATLHGGYISGTCKNKPSLMVTASTIGGRLSLSVCLKGNGKDLDKATSLLKDIHSELLFTK